MVPRLESFIELQISKPTAFVTTISLYQISRGNIPKKTFDQSVVNERGQVVSSHSHSREEWDGKKVARKEVYCSWIETKLAI